MRLEAGGRCRAAPWILIIAGLLSGLAVACGGGSRAGTYEEYVAAICRAGLASQEKLAAAGEPAFPYDTATGAPASDDFKRMAPAMKVYLDGLKQANPPADLKDWHRSYVTEVEKLVATLEGGGGGGDPFIRVESLQPPEAARARLAAIAATTDACAKAGMTFE